MTITPNPTDARLKYVWDKQKPRVEPLVMMDVIAAVADRVAPVASSQAATWADRIEDAGRKADPRFLETFDRWRHGQTGGSVPGEAGWVDAPFVDAVVALVTEMPEFKKTSPIDALIPWFAKEMNRLFLLQKDPDADEYPAYYAAKYNRLQTALSEDPVVVEWFEKKKPNLSKLAAEELLDEVEAFDQDRKPETVYEWDDGWKIVKLVTRTQLQAEGKALNNCLKQGSSYTEQYCKAAETGKSEFFSLRDPGGNSILSIQWTPGNETPEQVYGRNNEEPTDKEAEKIEEWADSRGGHYRKKFSRLEGSALRLAEYMAGDCHEDDESIEHYAIEWDESFSERDAKEWIDYLGCYGYEEAKAYEQAGLSVEDVKLLPDSVNEYVRNGYTKDRDELLLVGLLAGMMMSKSREPRPGPRVPEGQKRLPFEEGVFERKPPPEPPKPVWPRGLEPKGEEAKALAEATHWVDFGWDDKDDFDDVVVWWANWFSPQEAWIFQVDMAEYDRVANGRRGSYGLPLPVAVELRHRGVDALDVQDAANQLDRRIDIRDVDDVVAAVEQVREKMRANNKRRRSSWRRSRR